MSGKLFTILATIVVSLSGCSLNCEITKCGQKCESINGKKPECATSNCCNRAYYPQPVFSNDGSANYDKYRVVPMDTANGN